MNRHIQSVMDALRHAGTGFLPRGELFISRAFLDRFFGEHIGSYPRQLAEAARSMGLSLVGIDLNNEASRPRLSHEALKALEPFFGVGYIDGPVERSIAMHGFVAAMVSLRKQQSLFSQVAANLLKEVEESAGAARRGGLKAMALADDIAGNSGLLFSPDDFVNVVYPVYREAAQIIRGNGLRAFFHSDGDMRKVIEFLIEAGYECIHPVDRRGSMDVYDLRAEFGDRVAFMGHVDIMAWDAEAVRTEVRRAGQEFAKGGLILGSTGGVSTDVRHESFLALYPGSTFASTGGADG